MNKTTKIIIIVVLISIVGVILINRYIKKPKEIYITVKQTFTPEYIRVNIQGDESRQLIGKIPIGTGDLSLAYVNGTGWMAYSGSETDDFVQGFVSTHLAKTEDNGKTWQYVKIINPSERHTLRPTNPAVIELRGEEVEGSWFNEVPTLVYTPGDTGREWKLFWHKYFMVKKAGLEGRVLAYSWIAYKYASSPDGNWSDEIRLFGAGPAPLPPYLAKINLNTLHTDLKDNLIYSEPGSLYRDGTLYLSFMSVYLDKGNKAQMDIILIASDDFGGTWRYLGTLLKGEWAEQFDMDSFTATELAEQDGKAYLLASLEKTTSTQLEQHHFGTLVFEFEDISEGKLKMENGTIVANKWLQADTTAGQADFEEELDGGIYTHKFNFDDYPAGKVVTIRKTNIGLY